MHPLIKLAKDNTANSLDIGFYGQYRVSGSNNQFTGLFRDQNDSGKYKLFELLEAEPTTTVNTGGTGFQIATLVANLEGNVVGNLTGTIQTAAQANITSLGTLTALQVDNININGNTISSTAGTDLNIHISRTTNSLRWCNCNRCRCSLWCNLNHINSICWKPNW